jgi:hypothetical protein
LYEGQFDMTLATTSSVWRSTGGDQTRTAAAGSMVMVTPFYIANTAATANVAVSSTDSSAVILPANAVVTEVIISVAPGGNCAANIGFTPIKTYGPGQTITTGTNVPQAFVAAGNVAARTVFTTATATGGASLGLVANASTLVQVTAAQGSAGANAGAVTGLIQYFVADTGAENV